MRNKELTVWEVSCIITGYGIGAGVLAIPYIAQKNGVIKTFIIILLAFAVNVFLHYMIAETVQKCSGGTQIVSIFSRFLFRGKWKNLLTTLFFVLMAFVLVTNLTAYIAGAADVLSGFLPLSPLPSKVLFYIVAALVVLFGLKAVGLSEKYAVAVIFVLIAVLALASVSAPHHPLPVRGGGLKDALTTYWSLSLSLADIIEEQFHFDGRLCWLLATLPSFALSLLNIGGFIDFLQLAGGAIAIIVAAMVVPTYSRSRKEIPGSTLGVFGETPFCVLTIVAFILMAVGSLL